MKPTLPLCPRNTERGQNPRGKECLQCTVLLCHTVARADTESAPARKGLGRAGAEPQLPWSYSCSQAPARPYSIWSLLMLPGSSPEHNSHFFLRKPGVFFSLFHPWSCSHQGKSLFFLAVPGSLLLLVSLTEFSAASVHSRSENPIEVRTQHF